MYAIRSYYAHLADILQKYGRIADQYAYRRDCVLSELKLSQIDLTHISYNFV